MKSDQSELLRAGTKLRHERMQLFAPPAFLPHDTEAGAHGSATAGAAPCIYISTRRWIRVSINAAPARRPEDTRALPRVPMSIVADQGNPDLERSRRCFPGPDAMRVIASSRRPCCVARRSEIDQRRNVAVHAETASVVMSRTAGLWPASRQPFRVDMG